MGTYSRVSELLSARKYNQQLSENDIWGLQDSNIESYLSSFQHLVTIDELVNRVRRKKNAFVILDLMGSGKAWEELKPSHILGVTLSKDDRHPSSSRYVIGGDVLSKNTWSRVQSWLKSNGLPAFDIISCRPEGGIHTLVNDIEIYQFIISNLIQLLGTDGLLLSQVPSSFSGIEVDSDFESLLQGLQTELRVSAQYQPSTAIGLPSKIGAIRVDNNLPR